MDRVLIALAIVVVVGVVATVVRSRRTVDAPTQRSYNVPEQLDRADFARPDAAWLVAVFTSATCELCQGVLDRARVLESGEVAVAELEFTAERELHAKYAIDAVPAVVICDHDGVTRASFLGPVNATDLWAAVAEAREPGSSPEPHLGRGADRGADRGVDQRADHGADHRVGEGVGEGVGDGDGQGGRERDGGGSGDRGRDEPPAPLPG